MSVSNGDKEGGGDINCILVEVEMNATTTGTTMLSPETTVTNSSSSPGTSIIISKPYALSMYFVAERKDNRHAIRVMDGTTFQVVAPTTLVKKYTKGVWVSYVILCFAMLCIACIFNHLGCNFDLFLAVIYIIVMRSSRTPVISIFRKVDTAI